MFEIISNTIAAFFTFCIFSFLYKDNPFYKFAEALLVGITMGYGIPLTWESVIVPYMIQPIFWEHKFLYLIPSAIGSLFVLRFNRKLSWLSRYPIAISMGMVGMGVPMAMHSSVLVQMRSMMIPIDGINTFLIFYGTVAILLYFFFSKAHTGIYGKFTKSGIWYMMIGFGASFGMTVMARISLLIGRIQFLIVDWIKGIVTYMS